MSSEEGGMRPYKYEGEPGRYYPTLGLNPEPGSSHEFDRNPGDGRWTPPDPEPATEPDKTAKPAAAKKKQEGSSDA